MTEDVERETRRQAEASVYGAADTRYAEWRCNLEPPGPRWTTRQFAIDRATDLIRARFNLDLAARAVMRVHDEQGSQTP